MSTTTKRRMARQLCAGALTVGSWLIANRLVKSFDCSGCRALGYPRPGTKGLLVLYPNKRDTPAAK